jgi:hypothetical protein
VAGALPALPAHWIWHSGDSTGTPTTFRKSFPLTAVPFTARMLVVYDGPYVLNVNGKKITERGGGPTPASIDIRPALQTGENVVTIIASKRPPPQPVSAANPVPPPPPPPEPPHDGLLAQLLIHRSPGTPLEAIAGTDLTWQSQPTPAAPGQCACVDPKGARAGGGGGEC